MFGVQTHEAYNAGRAGPRLVEFSCWANVLSGIPQGSILGPLLFIIFINDLVDSCEYNLKLYLFADDAKMYCHIKDVSDMDNLQRGIDNFAK